MHFMKAVSIFSASIFTSRMIDALVLVTPLLQTVIDVVFVRVNQTARLDRFRHQRLNRYLLNIRQHVDDDFAVALDHAQNGRFFFCQRAAPAFSFQFSPSAFAIFSCYNGWMPFVTRGNVHLIRFDRAAQLDWLFLPQSQHAIDWSSSGYLSKPNPIPVQFARWTGSSP